MSNADLIEVIKTLADSIAKEAADALAAADKRIAELECNDGGGCTLSGLRRGDCEHAVGLPGKSIPGQHDGQDDTVDAYGKPNGWCWACWKSKRIAELEAGRDNFHMEYRMKCDEETKQLERKLAVAREAMRNTYFMLLGATHIGKAFTRAEEMLREALIQIGGDE